MRFESPTRHVFSSVYISHISCNIKCDFFSFKPIFKFIYFILSNVQERNAYGTNRSWCTHNHQPLKHRQSNLSHDGHIFFQFLNSIIQLVLYMELQHNFVYTWKEATDKDADYFKGLCTQKLFRSLIIISG